MNAAAKGVPRPEATVLLVRDGPWGLEVLMVTRNVASDFASGALVFPGGRVDAADGGTSMLEHCRAVPGVDAAALAFRVAGIRESFEEAHVLLARPRGSERLLTALKLDALEAEARAKLGRDPLLGDLVAGGAIELAADLLVPFAHWITPVGPPKRFATHFFLPPPPPHQPPPPHAP